MPYISAYIKISLPHFLFFRLVVGLFICATVLPLPAQYSLRFHGNGANDNDRVKIQIDDPANNNPGPPADIGATDFTLEFWMKANAAENTQPRVTCGNNINWIDGNIVFDRDRYGQGRKFGLSISGGVFVWGVTGDGTGDYTICGATNVLNAQWHHIAVQRRRADGWMWLYVDGKLDAQLDGPDGDASYPDNGMPCSNCCPGNTPCTNSDPYLVIGAEKHNVSPNAFSGWIDEVRLSKVLRYPGNFIPSAQPFTADNNTVALYHFDEGRGDVITDVSGALGGPSNGVRKFGGAPAGPEWSTETPFNPSLRVTLLSFSGTITEQGDVVLKWSTASETNSYGFEVQRKPRADAAFETLPDSFVPAQAAANFPRHYVFVDKTAAPGQWWYRLKLIDLDGTTNYHDGVQLEVALPNRPFFAQAYPNPFQSGTSIRYHVPVPGYLRMKIYSVLGEEIKTVVHQYHEAGFFTAAWDGRNESGAPVPMGVYFYKMEIKDLVLVRKVTFLKP